VVPQQALFLMNSSMAVDIARKLVARSEISKTIDNDEKVRWLYRILFQRLPRPDELALARTFLRDVQSDTAVPQDERGADVASAFGKRGQRFDKQAQAEKLAQNKRRQNGRFGAIQNPGEYVERRPLSGWEAYAQALLFANELAYVN
jgi:Protein of unknown function (DUF1553)